ALDVGEPRIEARVESGAATALLVSGCATRGQGTVARMKAFEPEASFRVLRDACCLVKQELVYSGEAVLVYVDVRATIMRSDRELMVDKCEMMGWW
ncbi:hypothetical protein EAH_00067250, partial [Eimeria acervulina]